jgi:hypothetical protein
VRVLVAAQRPAGYPCAILHAATYKKINCGCSVIWGCIRQPIENVIVQVGHWVLHGPAYSKFKFEPAATYKNLILAGQPFGIALI